LCAGHNVAGEFCQFDLAAWESRFLVRRSARTLRN
jgi:hypothetical protein